MYHCCFKVMVFSGDLEIQPILESCPVPDEFSCSFANFREYDEEAVRQADLLIWDLPEKPPAEASRKERSLLVLCRGKSLLVASDYTCLGETGELWEKPFTSEYLAFRFGRLLASQKLQKDHNMNQIWLDTAIDSIPDLVWFKDLRGAHLKVNNSFCRAVGKTKEQVQGRGHYYIWDLKEEEYANGEYVCLETEEEVLRRRETCLFDEKVMSKNGLRQFKTYKSPLFDDSGEMVGTVGIAHDVTDLQNMNAELAIILRSLPFSVIVADIDGKIINANQRFEKYFRTKVENVVGKDCQQWMLETFGEEAVENGGDVYLEIPGESRVRSLELSREPISDVFGNFVGNFYIYRDVTIERAYEHQMVHNANTDFLTGLYNRRYFRQYVGSNRSPSLGVLYLDLDNFKTVNDTYGHPVGDRALAVAAQALRRACPDDLISRVGGDEFLIGLWNVKSEEALAEKAEKIRESLKKVFQHSDQMETLSTSVGGALSDGMRPHLDELIRRSDLALYAAKALGRDRYCLYEESMETGTTKNSED